MKRRVAKLVGPRTFDFFEEDIPALGDGEMLIRNQCVGLCHSDLPPYCGIGCTGLNANGYHVMLEKIPYPVMLGHEPLGIVEAVGKNIRRFKEGDRVSGMIHQAFASHIIANEDATVKANPDPASCSLAEPLMCVANIAQIAKPEFGDRVAVIGCGFMGILTIMALKAANLRQITAVDLQDSRLELAKRHGATSCINPGREDLEDAAFRLTDGAMFDVVVEISGSLRGFDSALSIIRLADRIGPKGRGAILSASVYGKAETWSVRTGWNMMLRSPIIHVAHPRYCMDLLGTMQRGMDMYTKGVLKMEEFITHRFAFEDLAKAFEVLEGSDASYIKGIVTFS